MLFHSFSRIGLVIILSLVITKANASLNNKQPNFNNRAKEVTSYWSEAKIQNNPQHKMYQAIAAYQVGKIDLANDIIDDVINFNYKNSSQDHIGAFISMPLTYAYMRYGQSMGDYRKSALIKKVKSFDPFTGASENHKLLNISAAYILAESSPASNWKNYSNEIVYQKAKDFLQKEAKAGFKNGLWEFDSSNYIAFHINSWLLLHDFAKDTEIKKLAKFSLDNIFAGIAPEIIDGTWAASTSRTYTPTNANYRDIDGNISFSWLAFGHNRKAMGEARTIILAVSNYRIPTEIVASAVTRDNLSVPYVHREKHSRVKSGAYPFYKYSWIDRKYGMYSTYDGNEVTDFTSGQYHKWGIAWNNGFFTLKDVNNANYPTGDTAYNQVFQYQNVLLGVTIKPKEIKRYEKNIVERFFKNGWEFMQGGDGVYIAFHNIKNYRGWVIETASKDQFTSLQEFANRILNKSKLNTSKIDNIAPNLSYISTNGDSIEITYQNDKTYINKMQRVNGNLINYQSWSLIENPWMKFDEENSELILKGEGYIKKYNIDKLTVTKVTGKDY